MGNTRLYKNSKTYQIIKYLLIGGGILLLSAASPQSGAKLIKNLVKLYIRKRRFEKDRFLRDLRRLQQRELINYEELPNGDIKIILTKSGKKKAIMYDPEAIKLKMDHWDGKWEMVLFDIPEWNKRARDVLARKFKELKFYRIQKSVFITPYPCEDVVDFLCTVFEINRNHVLIFEVSEFEGQEKLRKYFNI